jgi:hypothetical protein
MHRVDADISQLVLDQGLPATVLHSDGSVT